MNWQPSWQYRIVGRDGNPVCQVFATKIEEHADRWMLFLGSSDKTLACVVWKHRDAHVVLCPCDDVEAQAIYCYPICRLWTEFGRNGYWPIRGGAV